MTETWTHQFNSEADFLDFLKMKRENEELKKENERLKASSPIECKSDIFKNSLDVTDKLLENTSAEEVNKLYAESCHKFSAAALPLPVASPIKCEAEKFLERAALGGYIISSGQCTQMEISFAGAENRMYVNPDGLGFILRPNGAQLPKLNS